MTDTTVSEKNQTDPVIEPDAAEAAHQEHAVDHAEVAPSPVTTDTSLTFGPGGDTTAPAAASQESATKGTWREGVVVQASRGERPTSFDVTDFAVPTGREEDWRFTPLDRIHGVHDGTLVPIDGLTADVQAAPGVVVETVPMDDPRLGKAGAPGDRVAAQAWSGSADATVVTIPAELEVAEPTTITLTGDASAAAGGPAGYRHLTVRAERFSRSVVVLDHRGSGTLADNVELIVGDGANLTVVWVADWDDDAVHLSSHVASLGRDAHLTHAVVTLGGKVVRITPSTSFTGPGASVEMLGMYFADAGQHLEHRLFVDHSVPHCTSNVVYKGALQGDTAHTVWVGDVLIRAAAEGTETYEVNRNLVLSDGARADSVPNLEIETGEIVGAGHASATGRFDDEQLFYLRSRGITEVEARRLVVRGFFAELVATIGVPQVQERLMASIEAELELAMKQLGLDDTGTTA